MSSQSKIAISHDWLLNRRGAERVLKEFCCEHSRLPIYALFFSPDSVDETIRRQNIHVSPLGKIPGVEEFYRYLLPWFPAGIKRLKVRDADLLLSIHHSVAKAIPHEAVSTHLCYCLSPMRYLWEPELYGPAIQRSLKGRMLSLFSEKLKQWDLTSNTNVDHFVAISRTVQARIRRFYGRDAEVIYPGVDLEFFKPSSNGREDFYLVLSALVPQKRVDLAVEAFNNTGKRLLIVGTGPLRRQLERKALSNVRFLGWQSDKQLRQLYCRAKGVVVPGVEDFGLVPVEAQACGCPVIAYGVGGVTETVISGESGLFFKHLSVESLVAAIKEFDTLSFDHEEIRKQMQPFSKQEFRSRWSSYFKRFGISFPGW